MLKGQNQENLPLGNTWVKQREVTIETDTTQGLDLALPGETEAEVEIEMTEEETMIGRIEEIEMTIAVATEEMIVAGITMTEIEVETTETINGMIERTPGEMTEERIEETIIREKIANDIKVDRINSDNLKSPKLFRF